METLTYARSYIQERAVCKGQGMEIRRALPADFAGILRLQAANLASHLNAEELQGGFLSAEFSRRQLQEIADNIAIIVAADSDRIAGYLCAYTCDYASRFPILATMIGSYNRVEYRGKSLSSYNSFVYGPVCIDRLHRGRGLLRGLYEALLGEILGKYEIGVAFVSKDNPRSLAAHVYGLGMTVAGSFEFTGRRYDILAFSIGPQLDKNAVPKGA